MTFIMLPWHWSCFHDIDYVTMTLIMLPWHWSCFHDIDHVTMTLIMLPWHWSCYHNIANDTMTFLILPWPYYYHTIQPFLILPPRCRTSQYRRTFIPLLVSLSNDLVNPVFDGVGLAGFKSRSNAFFWPSCSLIFCLQLHSISLLFLYRLVVWGWGLRTYRVSISLSRPCIDNLF